MWLWLEAEPARVGLATRTLLAEPQHELILSAASAWEIVIKSTAGKLKLTMDAAVYVRSRVRLSKITVLPIQFAHVLAVEQLPRHHADPFDRVLLAQAQVDRLTLVTADAAMRTYDVSQIDALD